MTRRVGLFSVLAWLLIAGLIVFFASRDHSTPDPTAPEPGMYGQQR
jgi:hypothetical protein